MLTAVLAAAAMLLLAVPVVQLRLGQIDARLLPATTQTRQLHDVIATHFPELNRTRRTLLVVAGAAAGNPGVAALRERIGEAPTSPRSWPHRPGRSPSCGRTWMSRPTPRPRGKPWPRSARSTAPFEVAVGWRRRAAGRLPGHACRPVPWAVLVIGVGTLVLLFLFTGSVLLPVKAVLTSLLSIGAALGVVVWVFQQGHLARGSARRRSTRPT